MANFTEKIAWFGPRVGDSERIRVNDVLASGYINDGAVTRELEAEIADLVGVERCIAVTSGTVAIAAALMGLGVGAGDEVIVPDLTFIATANAVRMAGADVTLVDVEPTTFNIDPAAVEAAIGPRTRAVVSVDVNGRGCDYEVLESLCRSKNLFLVCDAAEGLGSKHRGRYLGSFGNAGCFSFSANKTVTSGQGGMVATNDENLYNRLRELKDQGRRSGGTGGDDAHPVMGFNFKYTNLQAAVALAQLERLPERLNHMRARDQWYVDLLADCPGIHLPPMSGQDGEVRQWTDALCDNRDAIATALEQHGIGFRRFWHPMHQHPPYRQADGVFPNAERVSSKGLWLPSSFDLTEQQAAYVAGVIRDANGTLA